MGAAAWLRGGASQAPLLPQLSRLQDDAQTLGRLHNLSGASWTLGGLFSALTVRENVKVALETLEMLNIASGHRHLVLNRADDAVGISADKVEAILGMQVSTQVATSVEIAAATNAGTPIVVTDPRHPGSQAIKTLAGALTGQPVAPPTPINGESPASAAGLDDAKRGLFRRKKGVAS